MEEIGQRTLRAFQEGRPSEIIWNITNRCNLTCRHCYVDADYSKAPNELSPAEALELVDQIAEAGVPLLFVTGGEPMTRPDFWDILARAQHHGIRVVVSTNSLYIDDEAADRLVQLDVDYLATSLYGPEAFHDAYVGAKGAYRRTVENIARLKKRGIKVGIKTVVTASTYPHFFNLVQTTKDLGCGLLYACDLVEVGRAANQRETRVSGDQLREIADFILADVLKDPDRGIEYDIGALPSIAVYIMKKLKERGIDVTKGVARMKVKSACPVGKGLMGINAEGNILPCSFVQDFSVGNVRELGIRGGVQKLFELGRSPIDGACGECEAVELCRGCRVKAYHASGNILGSDPICLMRN
ncbi:MAG: radical SAM protein [Spirochaetales bacterium]|nr:radical SAM protein [Spirochaetales bacterium]